MYRNQRSIVMAELSQGGHVPAYRFPLLGVLCYTKRISELRRLGHSITTHEWYIGRKRHTAYELDIKPTVLIH